MSTIRLSIQDDLVDFNLCLERRLSIIKGNSASGKTTLYNLIDSKVNRGNSDIIDNSSLKLRLLTLSSLDDISNFYDSILVADDLDIINLKKFINGYKSYAVKNNLWFVIMSREEVDKIEGKSLSFSINSVYSLVCENNHYTLVNYYSNYIDNLNDFVFDLVLVEDSTAGLDFFKSLYPNKPVISTNGKSNIVKLIKHYESIYNNIFVIVDTASFGCHMDEFSLVTDSSRCNITFIFNYECFEELLLQSNFLNQEIDVKNLFDNLLIAANSFYSWEKCFEHYADLITRNKFYKYKHGNNLSTCFILDCDTIKSCTDVKMSKCDSRIKDNKIINMLVNTKYEFLLGGS